MKLVFWGRGALAPLLGKTGEGAPSPKILFGAALRPHGDVLALRFCAASIR
jgi:hypothetical protein